MLKARSNPAAISKDVCPGNKKLTTGSAKAPIPTAAGMAISIVVKIAVCTFALVPFMSPVANLPEILGIIAADMADAMAMGILEITTAFPE